MQNKFITALTLIAFTFVTLFSPFPAPVKTASAETAVINTGSLRLVTNTTGFSFKMDLMQGDTDPAVKELQKVLNSSPDTAISGTGAGSPGQESTYFGASTKEAVIKFQEKYKNDILTPNGLTAGTGLVGKATRTKLNQLIGVTTPTLASVGQPQSRAGTPATPAQTVETGVSVCKFIDLMAGINVVSAEKANSARVTMKCTTVTPVITPTPSTGMSVCSFIDLLVSVGIVTSDRANQARPGLNCPVNNGPSVVVKANGSEGPISVLPGTEFRLSWHSENTTSCNDGLTKLPVNGSIKLTADTSLSYPINCIGINGNSVTDAVTVIISTSVQATSSIQVLNSNIVPGYNFAIFIAETNVPTKMVITYTNQPTATSSVRIYESLTTINHSDRIEDLVPSSTYYARVAFIAGENEVLLSRELTFTTLSEGSELTQRTLSSEGGNGVVSIPDSESLKTDKAVTLEAWVKPTSWNTTIGMSNTADSVIISKGQIGGNISYVLSLEQGKLVYSNRDASIWTTSPVVALNQWTHVAVTANEAGNNIVFYVNGNKISSTSEGPRGVFSASTHINKANAITEYDDSVSGMSYSNTTSGGWDMVTPSPSADTIESLLPENNAVISDNIYIGNFYPASCNATSTVGNGFVGFMDNIKVWNVARTATQIKSSMSTSTASSTNSSNEMDVLGGIVSTEDSLVLHYSFDDGFATDLSNYSNNGSLKGDMEIVDDTTALSSVLGSPFGVNGIEFSYPESCDASLDLKEKEPGGYEVTFKGGVQGVTKQGQNSEVVLETCDNPTEDLVKSVKVIGSAPKRDPSYYNTMGSISVIIAPGLFSMKTPAVRDTIEGTAVDYISGPNASESTGGSFDSVGQALSWNPQKKSCMKPPDKGMTGTFAIVAVVAALIVTAIFCTPCAAFMASFAPGGAAIGAGAFTAAAVPVVGNVAAVWVVGAAAAAGYAAGSQIECEAGGTGCY